MDAFLTRLAELCRTNRTGAKWVIVPSYALGHTLGERLVLEGTDWANLRLTTPLDLALQMAAPFLVERGADPSSEGLGPALIMSLLLELPETHGYFRNLAEQPKMADALWATIRELRMAGLGPGDLSRDSFESADKHAELRTLLGAYEAYLAERHLADTAMVYQEALQHLEICPILPADVRIELPGTIWSALERRLLDTLPGHRLTPASLKLSGSSTPRRLTSPPTLEAPSPRTDAELLAFLLAPGEAPAASGDGTLTMFRAGGREGEVGEVFRRILTAGVPFDHVEVACAAPEHATLFWEKCQRHDWPVTIAPGLPVTLTRPARALLAFCEWVESGFPAGGLRRLLQSGDVRLDLENGPTPGQAARLLARSDATWGRQTYALALSALAAEFKDRATDPEADEGLRAYYIEHADHAERLSGWIARLVDLLPEPASDGVRLDVVIAGCIELVKAFAAKSSEMDGAAAVVLAEALGDLDALGDLTRPLGGILALIRQQVESLTVASDRARPGHLFVTVLRRAGYAGRANTFVVGLEEGHVVPSLIEDPVLLDAERQGISPELPTSRDRVSEAMHEVISRLASLGGRVCLSFSCRDLRQHRETFPSWLLLQAFRLLKRGDWTYDELNQALGEPVSAVPATPELALNENGWWLASVSGVGAPALGAIRAAFVALAQGEAAESARESDAFTIYDGFVREAGARLDPRTSGAPVSATGLETLAGCPFRYFLERGLGLRAAEDGEPDRDLWLDPATRGSLLHDLYARILRELRERSEKVDPRRHRARARELGEAALEKTRAGMPPPSDHVFERERQEILHDLDLFLQFDAADKGREPVYFEVPFGVGAVGGESLGQAEPVTLDLGGGLRFRVRGRIDRIDRLTDGTYQVIDYKTGWYYDQFSGTFKGGRLLQHARALRPRGRAPAATEGAHRACQLELLLPADFAGRG